MTSRIVMIAVSVVVGAFALPSSLPRASSATSGSTVDAPTFLAATTPLELTGVVLDQDSRRPLEGVWVFASYHELRTGRFNVAQYCVKTRGSMTGPDGRFHFPVEKRDGMSPATVAAIKPGYYFYSMSRPKRDAWEKQDASAYSAFVVYLKEQDPRNPKFPPEPEADCRWATDPKDTVAADRYLEIEIEELRKYGAPAVQIEAYQHSLERHAALGKGKK